ncbi:tRNA pseudouridine(55) synthase TruB [Treponema sp. OMZ 840]|uniref:tRNA pseudouridine(55) synthase TruB n=1 Tax=Treponema sp. OMZ 840 TaxID=244313 RepID=UPI003D92584C
MSFSDAGNPDAGMIAAGNYAALSGILPYAKKSGLTSFSSLGCIKKALHTKKVGHTGTLDSFAEGLLVVLTGSLTRLVPFFTLFDKTYEAVISFGEETDTLDPSGSVIRSAPLPDSADFEKALDSFRGNSMQSPPAYSAIHVNGRRASELAREGKLQDIPARPVTVFKSEILETRLTPENRVSCARVLFHVSKGTYIRSLARDIALSCNSAAHLIGLKRTKVGCFSLEQAAFADELEDFTIESVVRRTENGSMSSFCDKVRQRTDDVRPQNEDTILRSLMSFDPNTAEYCGFIRLTLREGRRFDFINGKPLKAAFFEDFESLEAAFELYKKRLSGSCMYEPLNCAVFLPDRTFCGVVQTALSNTGGFRRLKYGFVVQKV